jgi:prolipoprotein diacylglyceryltransferase
VVPDINIFGLSIKTFGLAFGLSFVLVGVVLAVRLRELGKPVDWAYEMVFAALIGGLIGARAWWVLDNLDDVEGDVLGGLFGGSGLTWYGGAIGGAVFVLAWAYWRGMFNFGSTCARRRSRSATPSGASAARSPATATTASRGTGRGRWPTRRASCRRTRPSTRPRSTRRWP